MNLKYHQELLSTYLRHSLEVESNTTIQQPVF